MAGPASENVELRVDRLSKLGEGVASHAGRTVFVEGALPGERVLARVHEDRGVLRGELLELRERSPARREPPCGLADRCGGCDWMHLADDAQREAKQEIVLSALEHVGRIARDAVRVLPTVASPLALGYRRRAVMHPSRGTLAFFGRRSHDRISIERCPALVPSLEALPSRLAADLGPVLADCEELHLLSVGEHAAFAAVLRENVRAKDSHRRVIEKALRTHGLRGAVLVPSEGPTELFGKPALKSPAPLRPEVPLFVRPDAFSQANEAGNVELVRSALELLAPASGASVLELYAGNGNFTFAVAARAATVLAVESAQVSLELARRSVQEGGVKNVRFVQGDARKVVEGLIREGQRFDALLLDPPRSGAKGCGEWARQLGAGRVVYVACDPVALARDARGLLEAGFRPEALQTVDMFPQTRHIEAVMSFAREP